MTRHLLLGYGRRTEHQRTLFAALSFWAWYDGSWDDVQTIIFTDEPEFFAEYLAGLPVAYRQLTPESLTHMRGPQQYVHRVKTVIVGEVGADYPADNVLFCDADTFFMVSAKPLLHQLQPGFGLLHMPEYRLSEAAAIWADFTPRHQEEKVLRLLKLIDEQAFTLGAETYTFTSAQFMWNTGLIGLAPDITALMPDVIALTDAFYAASDWLMSEQLAFSLALQARTTLLPGNQYLFHYWGQGQKAVMDSCLASLNRKLPAAEPLAKRLARVRTLTGTWRRAVHTDEARQTAVLALTKGEMLAGVKQATKVLLANSFSMTFAQDLLKALRKQASG